MKSILTFLISLVLAVNAGYLIVKAQTTAVMPLFTIQTEPDLPFSGAPVSATVSAANFNVSTTTFTWFRNGVKLSSSSGAGKNKLTVTSDPPPSRSVQLRVDIDPGAGFSSTTHSFTIETIAPISIPTGQLDAIKSDFDLESSSVNPNPGEAVSVTVITFAFDKQFASYRWYVNDTLQSDASGTGRFNFTLASGTEGETKRVRVDVTTPDGLSKSKSVTITVTSSPLYWWADTTIPYWYRGKSLPTLGSDIHVLALPKTNTSLTYRWEFNNNFIQSSSGQDHNIFTYKSTFPVKEKIRVTMRNEDGSFLKRSEIGIQPSESRVNIHEVKPLSGIAFEKALGMLIGVSGRPIDFRAVPFYFPREQLLDLTYTWTLNSQTFSGTYTNPDLFTLTSNSGDSSSNSLSVGVGNPRNRGGITSQSATINVNP